MSPVVLITLAGTAIILVLGWGLARARGRLQAQAIALEGATHKVRELSQRLAPILDIEAEATKAKDAAARSRADAERSMAQLTSQVESLRSQYATGLKRHEELDKEVRSLEENLEAIDLGLYKPHFTYSIRSRISKRSCGSEKCRRNS